MGSKANDPIVDALLVSFSNVFTSVFQAAIDLKLFTIIAQAGRSLSSSQIASHLQTLNPDAASKLDRMLCLLAAHSLLTCSLLSRHDGTVDRLYGLTTTTQLFAGEGLSLASLAALNNHRVTTEAGFSAKDAIMEDCSQFKKRQGMSIFEYMDNDPTFGDTFNDAMAQLTTLIMSKVLEIYKGFENFDSLVDVAGGNGKCLSMITSVYPSIKAINFDLPHVIRTAPFYPGIEHVGGDMFSGIPKADAIMIKDTLHNWNDEHCIKVLKNCYESAAKGKIIVIGIIVPEKPETTSVSMVASRVDCTMLLQPGGKERTEKEYKALCMASGFATFRLVCVAHSLFGVMEFAK